MPVAWGEELARVLPDARLVVLEGAHDPERKGPRFRGRYGPLSRSKGQHLTL